ncbi:MAG: hypothetical protein WC835_00920 [Candidatus Paceibacterota bacterium]|jgi:RNA polymerase-binding transcription factor DksA
MKINIEQLKGKLEAEKTKLLGELSAIGRKNPGNPKDWEAVPPETEPEAEPDQNIAADMVEGFEEAVSTEGELEQRLSEITEALKKIETENYGICRVCAKKIEERRMEANPAATTCMEHLNAN